jgi:hypothetical protein
MQALQQENAQLLCQCIEKPLGLFCVALANNLLDMLYERRAIAFDSFFAGDANPPRKGYKCQRGALAGTV